MWSEEYGNFVVTAEGSGRLYTRSSGEKMLEEDVRYRCDLTTVQEDSAIRDIGNYRQYCPLMVSRWRLFAELPAVWGDSAEG